MTSLLTVSSASFDKRNRPPPKDSKSESSKLLECRYSIFGLIIFEELGLKLRIRAPVVDLGRGNLRAGGTKLWRDGCKRRIKDDLHITLDGKPLRPSPSS